MELSNVLYTGSRRDVYLEYAEEMYKYVDRDESLMSSDPKERRKLIKKPLMTTFYGSKKVPEEAFGKDTKDYYAFYQAMDNMLKGPAYMMELMQSLWDPSATYYEWDLPGGRKVHIKVIDTLECTINMEVGDKSVKLPYRTNVISKMDKGLSLAANITHSIDALVKDWVVKVFRKANRPIATIHDAFGVLPRDVPMLMQAYRTALYYIYKERVFDSVLSQIAGINIEIPRQNEVNSEDLLKSKYALS
jgi:hypothetical protein